MKHELLSAFEGVRFLVLGTQGESTYCANMDAVVDAMAGMDCNGVLEFECSILRPFATSERRVQTTNASEQAARAWLESHKSNLRWDGDEYVVPSFIREHCSDELDEMAGELISERENDRALIRDYRSAAL